MSRIARPLAHALLALVLALALSHAPHARAQERAAFSQAELDRLLAPVALYPDALLSQMLTAATYPLEVVEAARWSSAHPRLQGEAAVAAAAAEPWDASVRSLLAFPQVLAWMDENPRWTSAAGDAFLAQEPQVMDTLQGLRARARAAGNLGTDDRVLVAEEGRTIALVPADPEVVYVPYYDPLVVYGTWWWPGQPPLRGRPPARARAGRGVQWSPGIRVSSGFLSGGFDWPRRHVRVDGNAGTAVQRRHPATPRAPMQTQGNAPAPRAAAGERRAEHRDEERRERIAQPGAASPQGGAALPGAPLPGTPLQRAPGGFTPGPGGFSPGPGGFSPGQGGLSLPVQRER